MSVEVLETHKSFGGTQLKYKHESKVLGCPMTFSLYLPENKENKPLSLIWWLSGLTCTDDNFTHKSGFQQLAAKYNVAVVAPDTSPRGTDIADDEGYDMGQGASFYLNATQEPWAKNYRMYDYLLEELPELAKSLLPNFSGKESIMGHSMGGHGALVIGLRNQDKFHAISAFAPILSPTQVSWGQKAFTSYLGDNQEDWKVWDSTELIQGELSVPILIHQGTSDNFYPELLTEKHFLPVAKKHGDKVIYEQKEGYDHSYYFIATFLDEHFAFHAKNLN